MAIWMLWFDGGHDYSAMDWFIVVGTRKEALEEAAYMQLDPKYRRKSPTDYDCESSDELDKLWCIEKRDSYYHGA